MTKFKQIAASLLMVGALFTTAAVTATPAQADPRFGMSINLGAPAPVYAAPVCSDNAYATPYYQPTVVAAPQYYPVVYSQWVGNWGGYVNRPVYVRHDRPLRVYEHRDGRR